LIQLDYQVPSKKLHSIAFESERVLVDGTGISAVQRVFRQFHESLQKNAFEDFRKGWKRTYWAVWVYLRWRVAVFGYRVNPRTLPLLREVPKT